MWLAYFLSCILVLAALFWPGYSICRETNLPFHLTVSYSPLLSIALFAIVGTGLYLARLSVSSVTLILLVLSLSFAIALTIRRGSIRFKKNGSRHALLYMHPIESDNSANNPEPKLFPNKRDALCMLGYLVMGFVVSLVLFVLPLDGPDSFVPLFDNAFHLSVVRSISETGFYTPLAATTDINSLVSSESIAFYPDMLHVFAALPTQLFGIPATAGMNAALFCFIACVFPLGCFSLIRTLFPNSINVMVSGAFLSLSFQAFPWFFLLWGPLYPNLASYALIPAFVALFVSSIDRASSIRFFSYSIPLLLIGIGAIAVTQTNGDFSAAVILIPFCIERMYELFPGTRVKRILAAMVLTIGFALLWLALYALPPLQSVVTYHWEAIMPLPQAAMTVLDLSFAAFAPNDGQAQPVLAILVLSGLALVLSKEEHNRWIAVSYMFLSAIYLIDVSTNGTLKHIISGFWYTDYQRVAASAAIVGIPIASYGLGTISKAVSGAISKRKASLNAPSLLGAISAVTALAIFFPSFTVFGQTDITAFGQIFDKLSSYNSTDTKFSISKSELEFADEASSLIGEDAIILNNPYDGSCFLYASDNLNMLSRSLPSKPNEDFDSEDSRILRTRINEYSVDPDVQASVEALDVDYVIQLDSKGVGAPESTFDNNYTEAFTPFYQGIDSIDETTPGFTLVLSNGDMCLYRINR